MQKGTEREPTSATMSQKTLKNLETYWRQRSEKYIWGSKMVAKRLKNKRNLQKIEALKKSKYYL